MRVMGNYRNEAIAARRAFVYFCSRKTNYRNNMTHKFIPSLLLLGAAVLAPTAMQAQTQDEEVRSKSSRLQVGGYGEGTYERRFYSDNVYRYSSPANYRNDPSHGRFDLPHAVIYLGYDFGRGWKFATEIEFEHGGTGGAYEQEYEEAGEWENERERGGEVELEQFWIEKSFDRRLNLRMGHIVVPVGLLNAHHEPLEFFTVNRSEGEATILPSTWHQTGVSLYGRAGRWRYELQALAGLDAMFFSRDNWIQGGAASVFEFATANKYALAARVDFNATPGLRMGLSGYYGHAFHNTSPHDLEGEDKDGKPKRYDGVRGEVAVVAFDLTYKARNWRLAANADYGYLDDAATISQIKKNLTANSSPYDKTFVGKNAYALGVEAGYDVLSPVRRAREHGHRLYAFGRLDYYDSYVPAAGMGDYLQTERKVVTAGINYQPLPQIAVKAQYSHRFLRKGLNDEPSVAVGVVWQGFFTK